MAKQISHSLNKTLNKLYNPLKLPGSAPGLAPLGWKGFDFSQAVWTKLLLVRLIFIYFYLNSAFKKRQIFDISHSTLIGPKTFCREEQRGFSFRGN